MFKKLIAESTAKSPWLFHINAGSCNGCDIELVSVLTPRLAQIAKEKAQAEENAKKLGAVQAIIHAKAGAGGKLFGAVTSQEISDALREQFGIEIEKNKIVQAEPIKTFGAYTVKAKLGYEVSGTINVLVVEG